LYKNSVTVISGSPFQNIGHFAPNGSTTRYTVNSADQLYATYTPTGTTQYVCTISSGSGGCINGNDTYNPTLNGLLIITNSPGGCPTCSAVPLTGVVPWQS